jgi:hypothetical protein
MPEHFFYFNNGVTAVCRDYKIEGNKLKINKFQIINGAQTVASISKARERDEVLVLFRLIKTKKVDTESGINRDIIQANNTQNAIRLSDFRSNDPIQKWLAKEITRVGSTNTLGRVTYQPKRTGRRGHGVVLKLEDIAKIRYAFLYDPLLVHAEPKSLWTPMSSGGCYEKAFGIDGELLTQWTKAKLDEVLVAIAFHEEVSTIARDLKRTDDKLGYLFRLRFHAVSLASDYLTKAEGAPSNSKLLKSRKTFEETWSTIWTEVRKILYAIHRQYVIDQEEPMTLWAFVRSEKVWRSMRDNFSFAFELD